MARRGFQKAHATRMARKRIIPPTMRKKVRKKVGSIDAIGILQDLSSRALLRVTPRRGVRPRYFHPSPLRTRFYTAISIESGEVSIALIAEALVTPEARVEA